jgi:hypothetical protein
VSLLADPLAVPFLNNLVVLIIICYSIGIQSLIGTRSSEKVAELCLGDLCLYDLVICVFFCKPVHWHVHC